MSKKKIEVVKSTTEPNKNDIWFNGKEFKYFGKKGWQNITKTSDIPTGECAGNPVEAAILEFNRSGLTAEQKAHNAEIYQKLFNNEPVQVYLNFGILIPLEYSAISYETGIITLSASAISTLEPRELQYLSLELTSDGDIQGG